MSNHDQNTILSTIKVEMDTAEKSRQWPFSCYCVVKEMKGGHSGFLDISQDELRLHYYMNKGSSVYTDSMKELTAHVQHIRNTMKNPGPAGDQLFQEYRSGGHPNPSSLEDLSFLTQPGASFRSKVLQSAGKSVSQAGSTQQGLFGNSKPSFSTFGATAQTTAAASSSPFSTGKPNPFGSATTTTTNQSSAFGSSAFGASASTGGFGSSAFGSSTAASGSANPFGSATTTQPAASSGGLFGSSTAGSATANPFGSSTTTTTNQQSGGGAFGGSASSGFGASAFGSSTTTTNASSSGFGAFGSQTTTQPKSNPFGSSTTSGFGASSAPPVAAPPPATTFGSTEPPKANPFGSSTAQVATAGTTAASVSNPFGSQGGSLAPRHHSVILALVQNLEFRTVTTVQ